MNPHKFRWPSCCSLHAMSIASWIAGFCFLLVGCQTSSITSLGKANQRPYDFESRVLHPSITVLPAGRDSMDVYIEWNRQECLYLRESPKDPFVSSLTLALGDEVHTWKDTLESGANRMERSIIRMMRPDDEVDGPNRFNLAYFLFTDENRNSATEVTVPYPDNFVSVPFAADGWPVQGGHVAAYDTIYFQSSPGTRWQHANAAVPQTLPAPPFSSSKDKSDTLKPVVLSEWQTDETGWSGFIVQPGVNIVGTPNAENRLDVQHLIHGTEKDHPLVRDVQLLIESSRYITTRGEYERMTSSSDSKAALDAFWLNCGNEKEAAANLIATYYGRVEEANRYFSGIQPGWRTDRGMVQIVFGIPDKIRRSMESEWWIYGEEGSANSIVFRFLHVQHPWDPDFYVLSRSIQFRAPWDRMVTNWRNGRIKPD